jgi:hypothetical protein
MEAFERIQQKTYGLDGGESLVPPPAAPSVPVPVAERVPPAAPMRQMRVRDFSPGLVLRVCHTLRFAEKTIRLAEIADPNVPVVENAGNAWFLPIDLDKDAPLD